MTIKKVLETLNTFETSELSNHFPSNDPQIGGEYGDSPTEHRPTQAFWTMWRENKETLKSLGVRVWKDEGYGDWWVSVPEPTTEPETESKVESKPIEEPTTEPETVEVVEEVIGEKDGIKVVQRDVEQKFGKLPIPYFFFIKPNGEEEKIGSAKVASNLTKVTDFLNA